MNLADRLVYYLQLRGLAQHINKADSFRSVMVQVQDVVHGSIVFPSGTPRLAFVLCDNAYTNFALMISGRTLASMRDFFGAIKHSRRYHAVSRATLRWPRDYFCADDVVERTSNAFSDMDLTRMQYSETVHLCATALSDERGYQCWHPY
jgi:hypothetical protein